MAVTNISTSDAVQGAIDWAYKQNPYEGNTKVYISEEMLFQFEDGTTMSGADLTKYLKVLQRIVTEHYPEELF